MAAGTGQTHADPVLGMGASLLSLLSLSRSAPPTWTASASLSIAHSGHGRWPGPTTVARQGYSPDAAPTCLNGTANPSGRVLASLAERGTPCTHTPLTLSDLIGRARRFFLIYPPCPPTRPGTQSDHGRLFVQRVLTVAETCHDSTVPSWRLSGRPSGPTAPGILPLRSAPHN
jgi:hypothetical protein